MITGPLTTADSRFGSSTVTDGDSAARRRHARHQQAARDQRRGQDQAHAIAPMSAQS
jgi:hypothetical protein